MASMPAPKLTTVVARHVCLQLLQRCTDVVATRPELQPELREPTCTVALSWMAVHALLQSRLQLADEQPSAQQRVGQDATAGPKTWILVGGQELEALLLMNETSFTSSVIMELARIRERYVQGSQMHPQTLRIVFIQPPEFMYDLPQFATVPESLWPQRQDLNWHVQQRRAAGMRADIYYLHPLLHGGVDGVPGPKGNTARDTWQRNVTDRLSRLLPLLCMVDLDSWLDEAQPMGTGPLRGCSRSARHVDAPKLLRSWLEAGMLSTVLETALQNPRTLLRDSALSISADADFGQVDLSVASSDDTATSATSTTTTTDRSNNSSHKVGTTNLSNATGGSNRRNKKGGRERTANGGIDSQHVSSLNSQQDSKDDQHLAAWLNDAACVRARTLELVNRSDGPLHLVALVLKPNPFQLYYVLDDHGLWRQGLRPTTAFATGDATCVRLQRGESYTVTVLFKAPRLPASGSAGEDQVLKYTGIFQSILTAVYWLKPKRAPNNSPSVRFPVSPRTSRSTESNAHESSPDADLSPWRPNEAIVVDVVGARLSGVLTRSVAAMEASLRSAASAAPFIPRALRHAFCLLAQAFAAGKGLGTAFLAAYTYLPAHQHHLICVTGVRRNTPATSICPVRPLLPGDVIKLDLDAEHAGSLLGWEPDMCLSTAVHNAVLVSKTADASVSHALVEQTAASLATVGQLSAGMHAVLVGNGKGIDRQVPNAWWVQSLLRSTVEVVRTVRGVAHDKDPMVMHTQRLLEVEGMAMLQDSFSMDVVTDLHAAEYSSPDARRTRILRSFPKQDGSAGPEPLADIVYRGPSLIMLAASTSMVASMSSSRKMYLLALQVPNMLENRPHVVYGSRVHVTCKDSGVEDVCVVLDQYQTWCIVSAPAWLAEAAANNFESSPLSNSLGGESRLPQAVVRFAIDRTPLQRMLVAALLNAERVVDGGLVPPEAPLERQRASKDAYSEFSAIGSLPESLLDSTEPSARPEEEWHCLCSKGPMTMAQKKYMDDFVQSLQRKGPVELNLEQRRAVGAVCTLSRRRKPLALFGPPGTGKTVTLVEMVLQLLDQATENVVLVCAPQNFTCDTFCRRLLEAGVKASSVLRLIDPRWPANRVNGEVMPCTLLDETWGAFRLPVLSQLKSYSVVICTCTAAALLLRYNGHCLQPPVRFTHVLIDEAGQSPTPEALLPLLLLASDGGSCLAGDPRQLGPQIRSPAAAAGGLGDSLLGRLIAWYRVLPDSDLARDTLCCVLVRNYRSHERLLQLPSQMFYGSALVASAPAEQTVLPVWSQLPRTTRDGHEPHLVVAPVLGEQQRFQESPALFNPQEAEAIAGMLRSLLADQAAVEQRPGARPVHMADVGVICFSRAQAICVRNLLRRQGMGEVNVGTVDDFQGQEMRVILISTVLTRKESMPSGSGSAVGLFNNPKRFNVAISRAMALLVVVGHPAMLRSDQEWGQLWQHCVSSGAVLGGSVSLDDLLDDNVGAAIGAAWPDRESTRGGAMAAFTMEQQARVAV